MFFTINVYSKNLKSLNTFLNFFNDKIILNKLKIKMFKTLHENPKKKKVFTILKSPHVNKTAQEQFEYKIYRKKIMCFTNQPFIFLIIFKNLKVKYLSDIYISIKFKVDMHKLKKKIKQTINFDSFYLENFKHRLIINNLKFLEMYGEFLVKKSLDSSVG